MGGNYDGWEAAERPIPNFAILCRKVFGCRFSSLAAPFGPSTIPLVCPRVRRMYSRSTSASVATAADCGVSVTSSDAPFGVADKTLERGSRPAR